jgi:hypothetical protein
MKLQKNRRMYFTMSIDLTVKQSTADIRTECNLLRQYPIVAIYHKLSQTLAHHTPQIPDGHKRSDRCLFVGDPLNIFRPHLRPNNRQFLA